MSAAADLDPPGFAPELIFRWDRPSWSRWRLVGMIVLSVLAHAAAFYALQVAYTPTGSSPPPPAQVVLIAPQSPESAALNRWLDIADPAAMTQPSSLSPEQVLAGIDFHYVPSYAAVLESFKPLPEKPAADAPPRTRKPGPVPARLLPPLTLPGGVDRPNANAPTAPTRLVFSAEIKDLAPRNMPPFKPPLASVTKPLDETVFLVGVPPGGGPAWIFRQASSGDLSEKGADAAARDYLARLSFRPTSRSDPSSSAAWGWVRISWGRDAYR